MSGRRPGSRASTTDFRRALAHLQGLTGTAPGDVRFRARDVSLDTPFKAAEAASAALAAVTGTAARLAGSPGATRVDSRHAECSLLSFALLSFADPERGLGPRIPGEDRTAAAGFYPTRDDRWIYLHPGFPHNTRGLLNLLGAKDDRKAVRRAVGRWRAPDLEQAIGEAGLCGAMARTPAEWDASEPGTLLAGRPAVEVIQVGDSDPEPLSGTSRRPLENVRVLDLTRVLAGPTCARTLASFGADALRVGAEHVPVVPLFVVDTGFGKRACHLNLTQPRGAARLRRLLRQADVFSQSYRSGVMERLGFGVADAIRARPGLIYVSINCYGHEGEWRVRPGWEQLAQTVTGMAHIQGGHTGQAAPTLLPAAVNDYITGYLAAAGVLAALHARAERGGSYWVRVSLARTAMWVRSLGSRRGVRPRPPAPKEIAAFSDRMDSAWGPLSYLTPAASHDALHVGWDRPPSPPGADRAAFLTRRA